MKFTEMFSKHSWSNLPRMAFSGSRVYNNVCSLSLKVFINLTTANARRKPLTPHTKIVLLSSQNLQ